MSDAYDVVGGSLKLKGVKDGGVKKKRKKSKQKREEAKKIDVARQEDEGSEMISKPKDKRTPAQIAFDRIQEKRAAERILAKASQSHKERVAEFNERLDNLTEHYDIPKVSWTK